MPGRDHRLRRPGGPDRIGPGHGGQRGGRVLSILPPHHIVVATREQLVPDLTAAFARLRAVYGSKPPGFISFITGPSRTGDIERILVLGAHGPRKLTIFCL